jgi:ankyrin repeat protein
MLSVIVRANSQALEQVLSRYHFDTAGSGPAVNQLLFAALQSQQYDLLAALLNHPQLDIQATDNQGQMVLHLAVMHNDILAVEILLRHEDSNIYRLNPAGESPLTLAAKAYNGQKQRRNQILDLFVLHTNVLVV